MTRHSLAVAAAVLLGAHTFASAPLRAQAQLPPSLELRVPKPPTVAAGSDGGFLAYELHVTNLTANAVRVSRIEVVDAATAVGAVLHAVADSALRRDTWRPGPLMAPAERPVVGGGMRAVVYIWMPVRRDGAPSALRHRVTMQQLIGDSAVHVIDSDTIPVLPAGPALGPPLRGEWVAFNGPSNASGHRRLILGLNGNVASGQRFGIDFVRMGPGNTTHTGDATRNETHYAYGEDILAVADGVVVEIRDGIPENVPGVRSRAVPITLETVAGNSVIIDLGGGRYAFYAHLIPGSHRVAIGDRVQRGQVIGRVGNSGNSTEPHLHFHLVDALATGTSTLGAEGIPYSLDDFELLGACAAAGCERRQTVTVRGGMPLQNQIVRFPE